MVLRLLRCGLTPFGEVCILRRNNGHCGPQGLRQCRIEMSGDGNLMGGADGAGFAPRLRVFKNLPAFTALATSCAIIVTLWLIAAWRWIATDSVVPWDSKNQSYAFFRFLATSLHSGSMPFWNPYHYG